MPSTSSSSAGATSSELVAAVCERMNRLAVDRSGTGSESGEESVAAASESAALPTTPMGVPNPEAVEAAVTREIECLGTVNSAGLGRPGEHEACEKFLEWARAEPRIKVVEADVPPGILPKGLAGRLYDVRVNPSGKKGPRTDDAIYAASTEIRERVARGNCVLELTACAAAAAVEGMSMKEEERGKTATAKEVSAARNLLGGAERRVMFVVQALRKFTGGLGDEDEQQPPPPGETNGAVVAAAGHSGDSSDASCAAAAASRAEEAKELASIMAKQEEHMSQFMSITAEQESIMAEQDKLHSAACTAFENFRKYIPSSLPPPQRELGVKASCTSEESVSACASAISTAAAATAAVAAAAAAAATTASSCGGSGNGKSGRPPSDEAWRAFFTRPYASATHCVSMHKANGEAAHLAVRRIGDAYVLFPGSKNVHMAVTCPRDLDLYKGDRYLTASEVARTVFAALEGMKPRTRERCLAFMAATGFTAVFELLQPAYQHVELLEGPPRLVFLAWSVPLNRGVPDSLCAVGPAAGLEVARHLGLEPVPYRVLAVSAMAANTDTVRKTYGREGDVVYFVADDGAVIGLLKLKCVWYVLLRALREKAKAMANRLEKIKKESGNPRRHQSIDPADTEGKKTSRKVLKRFQDIADWLQVHDETMASWNKLATAFIDWLLPALVQDKVTHEQVRALFPVVWHRFLRESGESDDILIRLRKSTAFKYSTVRTSTV